jgi:hypothetical protein
MDVTRAEANINAKKVHSSCSSLDPFLLSSHQMSLICDVRVLLYIGLSLFVVLICRILVLSSFVHSQLSSLLVTSVL